MILVPVQQHKHGVGSPPRGSRSGGRDLCQAARTAATCTSSRGGARCHGAVPSASNFRRGVARQSAAMSMAGFLVHCSFAAVQLQQKQSQSLRVDPYVSHRGGSIVVLPAANLRGPPDKYGLLTLGRPSVLLLLYASGLVSCVRQHASCQPSSKGNDGCSR